MAKSKESGFTAEEKAAMKERARELKAAAAGKDGEAALLEKVAEMPEPDRSLAERVHAVVKAAAPDLVSRTWYGMPAYAKAGKVVCFFQGAAKFQTRYSTLGFSDQANLDEGPMWPTSFAITKMDSTVEKRIAEMVRRAVG
jgi:uncharacterized protein YdhG (YjbR/CyaY superfamily)